MHINFYIPSLLNFMYFSRLNTYAYTVLSITIFDCEIIDIS